MQFEGVVSVLKPPGMTSSDVVVDIRRIFGERRVGHTGTLDPAAAGVLPICIGRATRLFDYLVDKEKEYIAEIRFGAETDTEDACGTVIAESSRMVSKAELEKILPDFIGEIEQVPPIYSSLSVNGVKMYKLARNGSVTAPAEERRRRIRVFLLETICELEQNSFLIRIRCSKGTYVRSLCRDIGRALGCCAYMPFLLRTASGTFDISEAHTIAELKELKEAGEPLTRLRGTCRNFAFLTFPKSKGRLFQTELRLNAGRLSRERSTDCILKMNSWALRCGMIPDCISPYGSGRRNERLMQNKDKINTPGTEYTNAAKPGTVVALGMFDGMHVGHKKIIDATVLIARQSGLVPAVFTFKNHPQELFGKKILRLCSNETRAALMRRQGIELVDEVEFTSAIRDLSAESFIRMLAERLNPKIIVAGFNYTFGKKKQGNSETLQRLCQKYGIKTAIIQPVLLGREPVSSTRVRNMITCGNVQDAQLLLGRAYALDGIIVQNKRIGRTIGYPTANIEPDSARVIPADGVYVSMARVNGDIMPACTNIGTNPTVGGTKRTIETHIFDYDEDIYGLPMSVCFVKKIRDVKKFESLDALKEQIRIDAGIARTYFGC